MPTKAQLAAQYFGVTRETHPQAYRAGLYGNAPTFLWPAPDTPGPEGDVWLGVMVRRWSFNELRAHWRSDGKHYEACTAPECAWHDKPDPAPAILAACLAADPAFAAQWKEASDAEINSAFAAREDGK